MKKKTAVILSSCAAIAVCTSLIAGSTYALFSSEDKVNIAVTSGKLDVTANISNVDVDYDASAVTGQNANLSADSPDSKTLIINGMLPGDIVTFEVDIESNSTVDIQYRLSFGCEDSENRIFSQLLMGVADKPETPTDGSDPAPVDYTYYISSVSAWQYHGVNDGNKIATKLVSLELPAYVGNEYNEELTCNINFAVEAVQNNAFVSGSESAVLARRVTAENLAEAVDSLEDGDALILNEKDMTAEINTDKNITFSVKGYDVNTLKVNAPNATIHYYIDKTNVVEVADVAPDSLHIYGNVTGNLTLNSGHVEVQQGARVATLVVAPQKDGDNAILTATDNSAIGTLKINAEAGKAEITVAEEATLETLQIEKTDGDVKLENSAVVKNVEVSDSANMGNIEIENEGKLDIVVNNENTLVAAVKAGGEVKLEADITAYSPVIIPEGVEVTLDLNGHTFVSMYQGRGFVNSGTLVINDSVGTGLVYNDSCKVGEVTQLEWATNAITNNETGYLEINGGRFGDNDFDDNNVNLSTWGAAVRNLGTAVINDGYFTCEDNHGGFYSYAIRSEGNLTINSGKVYGNMNGGISADAGLITINGGEINCVKAYNWWVLVTGSTGQIVVNDGTFVKSTGKNGGLMGGFKGMPSWDASDDLEANGFTINGGTFNYENEVSIYVSNIEEFNNALNIDASKLIVVLKNDIDVTTTVVIRNNKNIVLNLNGHKITNTNNANYYILAAIDNSNVTVINGTLETSQRGINVIGSATLNLNNVNIDAGVAGVFCATDNEAVININGGTIKSGFVAVQARHATRIYEEAATQLIKVNIDGATLIAANRGMELSAADVVINNATITSETKSVAAGVIVFRDTKLQMTGCTVENQANVAVLGNGTVDVKSADCGINTQITLIDCNLTADQAAIYHPQSDSILTVIRGTVTANETAIEIRSGSATLTDVTVVSSAESFSIAKNKNGKTTTGAALAVSQHTTNNAINVTVSGGSYTGVYALYEEDVEDDVCENIIVTVENAEFNGYVYSENCDNIADSLPDQQA